MFSNYPRYRYGRAPVREVICQIRFPEILSINVTPPADFQEQIRGDYPLYSRREESLPAPINGSTQRNPQGTTPNYQFLSTDGTWRVNLTSRFIALATTQYRGWEDFAGKLDKPLAAFVSTYRPTVLERIGLRYINFFDREALHLEATPYREMFAPCYLGPMGDEDVAENAFIRSSIDAELTLRGSCHAKIHAGPGLVNLPGKNMGVPRFIFDQDLFMVGNLPVNLAAGALNTLHGHADSLFRGAVTDLTHRAMDPEEI